jgi:uncharacterized protein YcnI
MKLKNTLIASSTLAAGALLAVAVPLSASAHISVGSPSTAAGSYTVLTFALPHGCDGSATTSLAISIPEQIASVTPTVNPGWDVSKVDVDLAKPITDGAGNTISTRLGQVVYTAKVPLADGLRDTFALSMQLPADAAGTTLEFPILQSCDVGETNWNQPAKADGSEPDHPAPAIVVTAATEGDGHGGGHDAGETTAEGAHDEAKSSAASDDVIARVLGIGGLIVGAVGVVLAVTARRKTSA